MAYLTRLPSGKWRAVYRGPDGRRRSITRPSKSEAKAEALELEAQIRRGAWADPALSRVTFREWHDEWAKGRVVEEATRRKNRSHLDRHIMPRWQQVTLAGIDHSDVQAWVAKMQRDGTNPPTIQACHALFSAILEKAVTAKRLRANPAKGVELPRAAREPERFLSMAEIDAIVAHTEGPDALLCELDAATGMRWGEIAGLHVKRLDLSRRQLHVVEVATRTGEVKRYPKSTKSQRALPLTARLCERLQAHVAGRGPDALVFTAAGGSMLDYTNWRRRVWRPAVEASGVAKPWPTFHDLRHSYVSHLIAGGADVLTVQALAGHESLLTTQRYAHLAPGAGERARAILESLDTHRAHGVVSDQDVSPPA